MLQVISWYSTVGEALSTLTTTCAWWWENRHSRLVSFKSMFLFLLFVGKARPSLHGHFIWGHVQGDAERNSPACPLQKQSCLDHPLRAVMLLSYAGTMLGYLGLKIKEKSNQNKAKTQKAPINLHQCVALGVLAHKQDDHIPHMSQTYTIHSTQQCENCLL